MRYLLLFLFLLLTPSSASAVWFDSDWDYRVAIEVVPSQVGSSTDITNYPVYVDLSTLPESFALNASSSGADIRVTKSDGSTETPIEVIAVGPEVINTATVRILTSTTTWQLPPEALSTTVTVEAWGGGGGGGDGANTGGGGGGGGAYASSSIVVATSTDYSITIGTGGAKGASGAAGGNGVDTSFNGGQVYADGGVGGSGCSAINCAGGAGGLTANSVGSTTYAGGTGGNGLNSGDTGGGGGEAGGSLGTGASGANQTAGSSLGSGGDGGTGGANAGSGQNGFVPGGGGGGGENNSAGSTGLGAAGAVDITYAIATTTVFNGELYFLADLLATSTASTTFYIYYGNPAASAYDVTDTYGRNNVWLAYQAVYHFAESSGNATDSTGRSYTLTNTGSVVYSNQIFGNSIVPPSGTNKFMGRTADNVGTTATGSWSVSMWVKLASETTVDRELFQNYVVGASGAIYRGLYEYNGGTRRVRFFRIGTGATFLDITGNIADNTLKNIVYTYNGTNQALYLNNNAGVTDSNGGTTAVVSPEFNLAGGITNQSLNGPMDEVRVATTTLTSAWRTTDYNNMSSPSTFYWIGAEETNGTPPAGGEAVDGGLIWFD